MSKRYKDYKIYCCFALNRLVSALNIDLYQDNLENKIDEILKNSNVKITKADIMYEIKSNHNMTNKILKELEEDGFIKIFKDDEGIYNIKITKDGILHIRQFNKFYKKLYEEQIKEHYKYMGTPSWVLRED